MNKDRVSRSIKAALVVVGCLMALYHLATTQYLLWGVHEHMVTHLIFCLTLVFLGTLSTLKRRRFWPIVLALLAAELAVCGYLLIRAQYLREVVGFIPSAIDWVMGILLVVVVIEGARQAWGLALPIVCIGFIAYFSLGHLLPHPFGHSPFTLEYVLSMLGIGWSGIFLFLWVSADFMFLFVLFGGVLGAFGGLRFFAEVGKVVGRFIAGGTAQTAVVSSALMGMVMGQAASNTVLIGSFTIPEMKRTGYTPEQAAAVVASASAGGQIMPPIMGCAVFIMASLLGVAYIDLCLIAFLPAALYYLCITFGVLAIAYKSKIPRPTEKLEMGELIRWAPLFIIPLTVIFVLLLMRFTPKYAAFFAIVALMVVSFWRKDTRPSLSTIIRGFSNGALAAAKLGLAIAIVGMFAQTITTTGLGVMIAGTVQAVSGGHLWIALLITMGISLLLGIGITTPAAYIIVALTVAPVLVEMGVPLIAAHFYAFWFAIFSTLTPPVALASMAGAVVAGSSFMKTSLEAFRLAMPGFILPFLMISTPVLLLQPQPPLEAALSLISIPLSFMSLVVILHGHFFAPTSPWERLLHVFALGGLLGFAFTQIYVLFVVGILLFSMLMFWQWRRKPVLRRSG